ncbi:major facilitator superfamily domain-containing protein [Annulohypoxylon truncatum]|uniref:major facilitator superfamily domain-containing protein n=1 Tax=Annulohypoxylon truncatum TaxID=327061 RepID=UPI002008E305|nr:major facilitator superfamily domain-containing protein [Annulohypoxylon truncatum]KAI1205122.1 major facilitator superfamily domain-containing protein [Annulohypoxylon truncatum]
MAKTDSFSLNQPQTTSGYLSSWRLATVIGSLCLGIFLFGLDINIIGVAIPHITTEFKSLYDVAWYGSAYMLTITAFQPLFGNLYKYFNAKIVYLISLFTFEVGSAICAAAPVSSVLIFGRALLGLGAAGLLQGALAIIGQVVTVDKVPLYQGIVVSSMAISVCFGPVIGGALTEYASWRWCFWINVPAGVFVILVVLIFVPLGRSSNKVNGALPLREKLRHMDLPGLVLFLGTICCLLLVLTWGGQTYAWKDSKIIGLFIGFGLLLICFCFWLVRQGDVAIIPLRVLKKRSIYVGSVALLGYGILSVVYGYYLPILFQSAQGASTTESGLRYIALVGPQIVALVIVGGFVSTWGYYVPYMIAGGIVCSVGAGLLTTVGLTTPTVKWAAYLVLTGLGLGMAAQLPYTALQAVLEPGDVATGNAIAVFSFHLAGAIGTAIGQNLLISGLYHAVPRYTNAVSPAEVIQAGATGLSTVATSPEVLYALRSAYRDAVRWTIILGLAGICMTIPAACAMEWVNIKKVAEARLRAQESEVTVVGDSHETSDGSEIKLNQTFEDVHT